MSRTTLPSARRATSGVVFSDHPTERGVRRLDSGLFVPLPIREVFGFFADARNLEQLTPPWLSFRIVTDGPIEMRVGTLIDYQLRVRRLPLSWRSEITAWDPPHRFVDEQRRGPYALWRHEHTFEDIGAGTLVRDRVDYSVPGGRLIDRLLVRRDLQTIFEYRTRALAQHFGVGA